MTVIDLFRQFFSLTTRQYLSPSMKLTYYTALAEWNENRRPERLLTSSARLAELAGLKTDHVTRCLKKLSHLHVLTYKKSGRTGLTINFLMCRESDGTKISSITCAQKKSSREVKAHACERDCDAAAQDVNRRSGRSFDDIVRTARNK